MLVYIDGKLVDKADAVVSVFDHGLLYGDGVFEGIRAYSRRVFKLREHLDRLWSSARTIMLKIPMSMGDMEQAVLEALRANKLDDAYVRVIVTRGAGDLGLDPRKCPNPTVIIIADKIQLYPKELYEKGITVVTAATHAKHPEILNSKLKSLNYLNNILAKIEAINAGAAEALMLSSEGYVAECSGDNIFLVKNGVVITPPAYLGALEGITQRVVLELAREMGLEARQETFTRHDIYNADECFLTGTAAEVIAVTSVDGRQIAGGKAGEVTKRLVVALREKAISEGTPY